LAGYRRNHWQGIIGISTNFLDHAVGSFQKVKFLPWDDIIKLIKRAKIAHPSVQAIYFNDDEFLMNRERIIDLCNYIISDNELKDLIYICMARVDSIDRELLDLMKKANFGIISYGVESFSDRILCDMDKKIKINGCANMSDLSVKALEMTQKAGITPRINFILFYPTININDLIINIEIATKLIEMGIPPTYYTFVEPFPGARIMNKPYNDGYLFELNGKEINIATKILPIDIEIRKLVIRALEEYKINVEVFKQKYGFNKVSKLPTSIDTLVLFYSVYQEAQLSTTQITNAIDLLMKDIV